MSALAAEWICPCCEHGNVNRRASKCDRHTISYCDDPGDGGCGEGPFMIRTVVHQDAYRIAGQGYSVLAVGVK